jgi:hypothetical protein
MGWNGLEKVREGSRGLEWVGEGWKGLEWVGMRGGEGIYLFFPLRGQIPLGLNLVR